MSQGSRGTWQPSVSLAPFLHKLLAKAEPSLSHDTTCCRASKDAEIERILIAEVDLRQDHEQQLTVERQQWCLEKDTLQKVLQEQQGTAHTLEQHLNTQIADLQANLASSKLSQEAAARMHYDTLAALQTANEQLQQQQSKLEQDLKAALAYRHKCFQQKQELQLLHEQVDQAQHSSAPDVASEEQLFSDQQLELISQQQPQDAGLVDDAISQEDIKTQVMIQCLCSLVQHAIACIQDVWLLVRA